jgi:hypothetical protein
MVISIANCKIKHVSLPFFGIVKFKTVGTLDALVVAGVVGAIVVVFVTFGYEK